LLIGGLKWDMRCYALLVETELTGLKLYLFLDGLARFTTKAYDVPRHKNTGALCAAQHLTNYSLQAGEQTNSTSFASMFVFWGRNAPSNSPPFIEPLDDLGTGGVDDQGYVLCHKWSAAAALRHIQQQQQQQQNGLAHLPAPPIEATVRGATSCPSWASIGEAAVAGISAGLISHAAASAVAAPTASTPATNDNSAGSLPSLSPKRFELMGVDVICDDTGQTRLIELQRRPSLAPTSPFDIQLKSRVLAGLDALLESSSQAGENGGQVVAPEDWLQLDLGLAASGGNQIAPDPKTSGRELQKWHDVHVQISCDMAMGTTALY
jgi:hypothetical protein